MFVPGAFLAPEQDRDERVIKLKSAKWKKKIRKDWLMRGMGFEPMDSCENGS
jgi:hypothetical protein